MMPHTAIVAGIDPASTTGLIAIAIDAHAPSNRLAWRWVDACTVSKSHREHVTGARNALALFDRARAQLLAWHVVSVAIERPAEGASFWDSQKKARVEATGTAFGIGESYGMLAAAAHAAGCRVHDYAPTSRKANPAKNKKERVGWMPMARSGHLVHVAPRVQTLAALHELSIELRLRPYDGILPPDRAARLDENILMALGVLRFHLQRQIGAEL